MSEGRQSKALVGFPLSPRAVLPSFDAGPHASSVRIPRLGLVFAIILLILLIQARKLEIPISSA